MVHRDLKPDNVIVVPMPDGGELVKLLDFGVAKLLNRDDEDVGFQTAAGSVIGTPAYMSPEQAGGMVIDARSDIYSLGAIMYELFTGQPMFRGRSFGEYVRKHLTEMPVPPHDTPGGAGIDPRLEALILRSLDKDPDLRFAHISELREALIHLLGGADALGDPGASYPPGLPRLSASGQRPLSAPLGAMLPRAPTPPPASQVSQSSQLSQLSQVPGVPAPQAAYPANNSGPHRPFASGPHEPPSGPNSSFSSGPHRLPPAPEVHDPHSSAPHRLPLSPEPHDPRSAGPHAVNPSGPHGPGSFGSGPHEPPAPGPYSPHSSHSSQSSGPHAVNPTGISGPVQVAAGAYPPPLTLDGAYSLPPPLTLDGAYRLPVPPASSASSTPWWAWFSIGALAVGVGIAAAIWYAGRGDPDLSPRPPLTSRSDLASSAPGATAPGATAPGATAPGATAPGATAPGATAPGATAPGATAPGATAPGATAPGATASSAASGSPAPGSSATGSPASTTAPGSSASATPPGATASGSSAPGSPAPGSPAPGSPAPGTAASAAPASGSAASAPATGAAASPSAPPGTRPALVEVRFDSTPSGSVFAEGQAAELCRTPCAFDIDPADGGPADHRAFVVRRAGYVETAITVDLGAAQREFRVTLPRAEPGAAHSDARSRDARNDARNDGRDTADRHPARRPARPARKGGKDAAARTDSTPDARPDARPDATPDPGGKHDARPATKKSVPPIDPTDTLDPFRKK